MATVKSNKSFTRDTKEALCDLFHTLPEGTNPRKVTYDVLMNRGIIFVDANGTPMTLIDADNADIALGLFKTSNECWDKTFHKSWEKVANAPLEVLVWEQVVHYFSTYGMEMLGLDAVPVLPVERVITDPATMPNTRAFTVIRVVPVDTAIEMVEEYLRKTIAPHRDRITGIINLMALTSIQPDDIKSFELLVARCQQLDVVPTQPQTFLRYLVYLCTDKTTLIKDKATIGAIKHFGASGRSMRAYFAQANLEGLASIFHRFKPIFLAFKTHEGCGYYINKIRRLADTYHKPLSDVSVQNVSALAVEGRWDDVVEVLNHCTGRQLIKLANFCAASLGVEDEDPCIYNIRNGKVFIAPAGDTGNREQVLRGLAYMIGRALGAKYAGKLKGKLFYMPDYITYAAPITEKQFIGNIPYGSHVDAPDSDAVTAAIYWENYKGRTDIDLHMQSVNACFGWNASYRDEARTVLYSGDMTDATNGAVEAFRFSPKEDEKYLLTANNFTGESGVPFDFFLTEEGFAQERNDYWGRRPMTPPVDVKNALFTPIPLRFADANAINIGLFDGRRFYFYGGDLGLSIVPKRELYKDAIEAVDRRVSRMLPIDIIIRSAGAYMVSAEEMGEMDDETRASVIDLTPAALTARTLLDIVDCGD